MKKHHRYGRALSAGYRVSLLHWLDSILLNRRLEPQGIKRGQVAVLADVLENDGVAQDEINALQGTDRSATSRALKTLERMGFVTRCENPENGRQKLVFATPKARAMADAYFDLLHANNEILFTGFNDRERAQCLQYLDRMIRNTREALQGE